MDDLRERHAELILLAHELDAVLDVRQLFAEGSEARQTALCSLHEVVKFSTEQIDTGIGNAAEVVCLEGETGNNERAATPLLVARLAVTVIGHVLGARRAHVVLDILVEDGERARGEVRHHVLDNEPAGIGQPFGCLSVAELRRMRGFCAAQAASTTTLAGCTCRSFFWS